MNEFINTPLFVGLIPTIATIICISIVRIADLNYLKKDLHEIKTDFKQYNEKIQIIDKNVGILEQRTIILENNMKTK